MASRAVGSMEPRPLKKVEEGAKEEDDSIQEQPIRPKVGRPRKRVRSRMLKVKGKKLDSKLSGLKYSRMNEHSVIHYDEEPLRRSKREKRLMFATLNVAQIDKQILNPGPTSLYLTDDELDPYEKLLSPCRNTRRSARLNRNKTSSNEKLCTGDWTKQDQTVVKEEEGAESGEEEEVREVERVEEAENASEEDEDGEEEEEAGYYNLRKRQPVIYHIQPLQRVMQSSSPPNKSDRKRRRSRHGSYHSNSLAYQTSQTSCRNDKNYRKRQAHRDSSTTSSDSDSDEARFRRRKGRSMAKSRIQCLPMNFVPEDISHGVLKDRIRVGASLADINPMNIDQSVTFDSIGGLKSHIRTLKEMIIFPFLYPEVFERFQIKPPRGVLFHGPPGCGKTLVARVLANECSKGGKKVAFFMRKGADCLSKWVGESERQLRLLFDQAYQYRPSIIFFDEIDGLAPIRSSRQDQIHSSIVSTLLALMDGLDSRGEIVVIGATNRIDAIDPALRRPGRFDRELIFPLPSREDRRSILAIHTHTWNPKLKSRFISELANRTGGYCGADLSALCTEAALFALRRRYPQIYNTTEKLVLDTTKIKISSADFQNALKAIIPTAQRSDSSMARALPSHIQTLFLSSLKSLLSLVCFVFQPSWKAVKNASAHVEMLLKMELDFFSKIDQRVEELRSPVQNVNFQMNCGKESKDSTFQSSRAHSDPPRRRTPVRKTSSRRGSLSNSIGENSFLGVEASLLNESQGLDTASSPKSTGCSVLAKKKQARMEISLPLSFAHLHQRQQAQCVNLGKVFFDLTELSSLNLDVSGKHYREESILEECKYRDGRSRSTSRTPSVDLTHYMDMMSHPHIPPAVYHPRLILCGHAGMGQSSYLGPALIHALEDLPVKTMDLLAIFGSSTRSPEESCTQILREVTRTTPSILYLPRLDSWWNATSEAFQLTLLSFFSSLPSSTPLLMLATAECHWNQLPDNLQAFFRDAGSHSFTVPAPSLKQRKQFFCRILLEKPLYPPPPKPRMLSDVPLEKLPVAAPPQPRELNKEEWSKISRQRDSVLRELRMFLRDATNKLLAERKLKEFARPVNTQEVPDYLDIIRNPMDLGTVMKKIDDHCYNVPKQWIADIELISRNALEYNPEHNSESRLLRHRASALQDMAHSFLDNELSEDFEKQCEDIQETYQRFIAFHKKETPCRSSSDGDSFATTNDMNTDVSVTVSSDIYDAPRRSLRQLGLKPTETGFPNYSPIKAKLSLSKVGGNGDEEDDSIGDGSERAESSMSIEENSNTSFQDGVQEPLPHNGNKDPVSELTSVNVRHQTIKPWEDMVLANMDRHLNQQSSRSPEGCDKRLVKNQVPSGKISPGTKSIQAYANMVTPNKQQHSSIEQVGNHTGEARSEERESPNRKVGSNNTSRRSCSIARESKEVSPQPHRVVINFRELVDVYKKVVNDTEDCSIEKMEQLHATFEQLVFRHRMHWDRQALLMDLRLATDLFFQ